MDWNPSEDERAVAELARKILEDHATNERLKALEAASTPYDADLWKALAEADLLGTAMPESDGGSGLGFFPLALLLQEVGRTVAPVPAFATLVLGALPLARFGSENQRKAWLPEARRGTALLTGALTEPDSSDPLVLTTTAEVDGGAFRLTGTKSHVPYGEQAARVILPARLPDGTTALFLLDPASDGVTRQPQSTSDRHPHARLELNGVSVSADDRLGDDGRGLSWLVEHALAARCMMQLGVIERALEMTAAYARDRVQFERPIGSFQAVHQRAADAYINAEAIRLSALEAAWRLSRDLPATAQTHVAKFWAAEGGQFAAFACQHLHGGVGIDIDYPLHRHFIWATQIEHELGSAKHQLGWLGREIADGRVGQG